MKPNRVRRRRQMEALRDHICQLGPNSTAVREVSPALKERPISFNDEMIRALLTGRKNQTRRLARGEKQCPFGAPGDLLWVRERWAHDRSKDYLYAVDSSRKGTRFHAPFTMPRAACRALLRVTAVELQRVQSITPRDARDEGYDESATTLSARRWFAALWDRIYSEEGTRWIDNPVVWVVRFEPVRAT